VETWVAILVVTSAFMHASWNALVKSGADRLLTLLAIKLPNMGIAAISLLFFEFPRPESWPYLFLSSAAVTAYYFCLLRAYRAMDFNLAYPVARGTAPVLVLLLAALMGGETIGPGAALSVAVISLGICGLAYHPRISGGHLAGLGWAMMVGFFIAVYTVTDGLGARISGDAIGYTAAVNVLVGMPIVAAAIHRDGAKCLRQVWTRWRLSVAGGAMMFAAYAVVVFAMTRAPMAPVAALRETGVIFGALIGALIFKEAMAWRRVVAAAVVTAGVAMLIGSQ
jgi:drug/metabolite transporter (DMT)-like permease